MRVRKNSDMQDHYTLPAGEAKRQRSAPSAGRGERSVTFPWKQVPVIQAALQRRGYAFKINKHGLTVEWDDPVVTPDKVRWLIGEWIAADAREA
jgi:hypothetical protein